MKFESLAGEWSPLKYKCSIVKAGCVRISKQKMWVIGGKSKGQRLISITEVDLTTGQQILLPVTLNKPKSGAGAVFLDGKSL